MQNAIVCCDYAFMCLYTSNERIKVIKMTMTNLYGGIKLQMNQSNKSKGANIQAETPV